MIGEQKIDLDLNERIFEEIKSFEYLNYTFKNCKETEYTYTFTFNNEDRYPTMYIQIIKVFYKDMLSIINDFDVDCCSILRILDSIPQYYCNEKCLYSIKNKIIHFDFDCLSYSYEYRICKYNLRGFGVYIPFFDHFKKHMTQDFSDIIKLKNSDIISYYILNNYEIIPYENKYIFKDIVNNDSFSKNFGNNNTFFDKRELEDFRSWYPKSNYEKLIKPEFNDQLFEINDFSEYQNLVTVKYTNVKHVKINKIEDDNFNEVKNIQFIKDFLLTLNDDFCAYGSLLMSELTGLKFKSYQYINILSLDKILLVTLINYCKKNGKEYHHNVYNYNNCGNKINFIKVNIGNHLYVNIFNTNPNYYNYSILDNFNHYSLFWVLEDSKIKVYISDRTSWHIKNKIKLNVKENNSIRSPIGYRDLIEDENNLIILSER
jgi:hypothetical protein